MNRLPHLTPHLTEEQIFTLLDQPGSADATVRQHLLACAHCTAEVTGLGATLTSFRAAATGLAFAQPLRLARTAPAQGVRRHAWAASFAMASVALAVTLVHPLRLSRGRDASPIAEMAQPPVLGPALDPARSPAPGPAQPVAESDEALLNGIQQDLSTSVPPSLEPLEVSSAAGATN
jgi:hypothetical protein